MFCDSSLALILSRHCTILTLCDMEVRTRLVVLFTSVVVLGSIRGKYTHLTQLNFSGTAILLASKQTIV